MDPPGTADTEDGGTPLACDGTARKRPTSKAVDCLLPVSQSPQADKEQGMRPDDRFDGVDWA